MLACCHKPCHWHHQDEATDLGTLRSWRWVSTPPGKGARGTGSTLLSVLKLFLHTRILSFSTLIRSGPIMIRQLRFYYTNDKLLALYLRYVLLFAHKILRVT